MNKTNQTKINWDNEVVPSGPWYDKIVFTLDSHNVTVKELLISAGTIVGIIIAAILVCLLISYCNRKKIAEAGRRMSTLTVR